VEPLPQIKLKIDRRSNHPWIFQKMVEKPAQRLPPGTVVDIVDRAGQWVGRGFYNGHSRISLRVLTDQPDEAIDAAFFARRLDAAIAMRRALLRLDDCTNAYRLIHSEGDRLSGLVVDRFGDLLVLEFFAAGPWRWREALGELLLGRFPGARLYWFAESHVQKQESFDCRPPEAPPPVVVHENGVRFRVQAGARHKTGFFADQRENRLALSQLCAGRRVLDLCCNSGGFALYAKVKGDAAEVAGVDVDEEAIELARQNANLNQVRVQWVQADLFPWLRELLAQGRRWDVVVLDPAKQTRDKDDVQTALKKYFDMNKLALTAVSPGGVILSCSCTGLVSEDDFLECLRRAAWQAGRTLQVFRISGAAADHPFLAHAREGRYLKAVWARVG
jgi:23S rRNA (cytosine1962-C5)-methyltransferase